jgi:Queuosine biosynthesis protein
MIAASHPVQRPPRAKLLVVAADGIMRHVPRAALVEFLRPGDLVVANDAATLPASLAGTHVPTGDRIEVRLAGRLSLDADAVSHFSAVVFGAGDFRARTEDRPPPPRLTRSIRTGPPFGNRREITRTSSPRVAPLRRQSRHDLGRPGAPRPPDPVRLRADAAGDVGRLDADRRPAGCVRASLGWLRFGLANAGGASRPRRRNRHDHPCGRHLIHRGRGAGPAPAVRRTLPDSRSDGLRDPPHSSARGPHSRRRYNRGTRARTFSGARRPLVRWRGPGDRTDWPGYPLARRRCYPHRHSRAGHQPL